MNYEAGLGAENKKHLELLANTDKKHKIDKIRHNETDQAKVDYGKLKYEMMMTIVKESSEIDRQNSSFKTPLVTFLIISTSLTLLVLVASYVTMFIAALFPTNYASDINLLDQLNSAMRIFGTVTVVEFLALVAILLKHLFTDKSATLLKAIGSSQI